MNYRWLLRHFVFWPGVLSELIAQVISFPAIWFLIKQPGFFRFEWLGRLPNDLSVIQIVIVFAVWLINCGKLLSIFGFLLDGRSAMQIFCVLQLLFLAIVMSMSDVLGMATVDWFNIASISMLVHSFLAIALAFGPPDEEAIS